MFRHAGDLASGAAPFAAKSYHSNGAYDVDPSLGSTETYGFDEYAALYTYYRVIGYSYEVTFVNRENAPMLAYVVNSNVDAAAIGTAFYLYSTNPHCQSKLISNVSPNMHTFRGRFTISQITGTPACETADTYRALVTALPSDLTWLTLAAETIGGSSSVINCIYDLKLKMHIRFYSREVDLTLAGMAARINAKLLARSEFDLAKRVQLVRQESQKKLQPKTA